MTPPLEGIFQALCTFWSGTRIHEFAWRRIKRLSRTRPAFIKAVCHAWTSANNSTRHSTVRAKPLRGPVRLTRRLSRPCRNYGSPAADCSGSPSCRPAASTRPRPLGCSSTRPFSRNAHLARDPDLTSHCTTSNFLPRRRYRGINVRH